MNNITIVSHKYLSQPDDDLVEYLNQNNCESVAHIKHGFSDAGNRRSCYILHRRGRFYGATQTKDYKIIPEPLIYAKELFFTLKWSWRMKSDLYIAMDGLCAFFGIILRFFGRADRVIFWAMDFVPNERFRSGFKNKIYRFINSFSFKNSDEVWDLSPKMAEARKEFWGIMEKDYVERKDFQQGMWIKRIKKFSFSQCDKSTLVFMGHLSEKQGAQLVMKAIPKIASKITDFKFKIIGDGYYKKELIALANKLNIRKYCEFFGKIEDRKDLENEIAKSCLAVAPYIKKLDTFTRYADSGKVKTYLACGVPVLLTDVPWNAKEIEESGCGTIIKENENDISEKIIELMDERKNQEFRNRVLEYSKKFDWEDLFRANLKLK